MTTRTLLAPSLLFAAASALAAGFRAAPSAGYENEYVALSLGVVFAF